MLTIHNLDEFNLQGSSNTKSRGKFAVYNADQSKFIFKGCFNKDQPTKIGFIINDNPIITAFVGFVFQLILKGRAPDHWLVKTKDKKVLVASKFLNNFDTCKSILIHVKAYWTLV